MEPEQENGLLLETVVEPLSREASIVLEQQEPTDGMAEVPDPTQTPPVVIVDDSVIENIGKDMLTCTC